MRNEVGDVTSSEWTYIRKVYFNNYLVLLLWIFSLLNFLYFSWDYNIIPSDTLNITSLYWMDDTETVTHFELTQYAKQTQLSQIFDERHTNWKLANQEHSGSYVQNINHRQTLYSGKKWMSRDITWRCWWWSSVQNTADISKRHHGKRIWLSISPPPQTWVNVMGK